MDISKDQQRRVEKLHSYLGPLMEKHYKEVFGVVIDADIAFVDQTTMGEVIQSFGSASASYTFTIEPFSGPAMIDYSMPVAQVFAQHKDRDQAKKQTINEEERARLNEIFKRDLQDLQEIWKQVEPIQVSDAEFETNPEYLEGAIPRGETVILVAFEINGQHFSGLINVVYPTTTLEPVLEKLDAWTPES